MSNFFLVNDDTKINLDLVSTFRYHKATNSVYITFNSGDTVKFFVDDSFDFDSVADTHHVNTIPAEENRYIVIYNVDITDNDAEAVGWMEQHQVIGWERINSRTLPITTQYLAKDGYNKKKYILDIKDKTVREIGKEFGMEKTRVDKLDEEVAKGTILEDHAEYIRNVVLEQFPEEECDTP